VSRNTNGREVHFGFRPETLKERNKKESKKKEKESKKEKRK